ncbi:SAM-dependent methyltransferase [Massilia sp. erpn]|uniref:SAM-dependent methyltransferase n=1 Tax=Massilia sp. erpn TaxID=2738142 RepID=UPI002106F3D0|nr:SAM-dependent methyltransferase [Massilia sp. erpn]UTY60311.1 SAM-dependent methyltransferase [Massilia sp. erpn]
MLIITIKQGKEAGILAGSPWIYQSAIEKVEGRPQEKMKAGATAIVQSSARRFLARAGYSAKSQIAARIWTLREDEPVDHAMMKRRVKAALEKRAPALAQAAPQELVQLIDGDADGLSGLLVHSYGGKGGYLICQFQSGAVDAWKVPIVQALLAGTGCPNVYERCDALMRKGEGLMVKPGALAGEEPPQRLTVSQGGRGFPMDLRTGFEYPR